MSLVFLTVCIQKEGDHYSAYSPNLLGVSVTGDAREDVERQMLDRITAHIEELRARHDAANKPVVVATKPLKETIRCLFTVKPTGWTGPGQRAEPRQCEVQADKDGLCWQHWRQLYGHAVDTHHTTRCDVCGETDSQVLRRWDTVCPGKASDPDWREKIEARKTREREVRTQEELEEKIRRAAQYAREHPPQAPRALPRPSPHDPIGKRDFASRARVSYAELDRLVKSGEVDGIMVGGRMYFSRRQLERLIKRRGGDGQQPPT
jgi:predicted RNase H-like HicB family nuclease